MDEIQELLATFRGEAEEQIEQLDELLETVRSAPEGELAEVLAELMRIAHNLKGGARSVGEEALGERCHELEDALAPLQGQPERPAERVLERLAELVSDIQGLAEAGLAQVPSRELLERLGVAEEPAGGSDESSAAVTAASIRVDTERLDRLMSHGGELLAVHAKSVARSEQLRALSDQVQELLSGNGARHESAGEALEQCALSLERIARGDRRAAQQFGYLTQEISRAMKQIRMLPLSRLAASWRRTVRECSQQLGKQIGLRIEIGDVEIDRHVLELLRDPLLHLLRNAVDHGIERPAERARQGKDARGRIVVRAELQGSVVRLEIEDDGAGLDLAGIVRRAVDKGLVDEARAATLTVAEQRELLFSAGLSSAEDVSQVSGRGVGLNIVRENVERLGGDVQVSSDAGRVGTRFVLRVPVSLLSSVGLLVQVGQATYALPIEYVARCFGVARSQVRRLDSGPVVAEGDEEPVRLAWLAEILGVAHDGAADRLTVLTLSRGARRLGIVVDGIIGEKEFVTKPLPWNLEHVPGVSGAIILADGSLAPVLDVGALFAMVSTDSPAPGIRRATAAAQGGVRSVLVVDDSLASRVLGRNMLASAGYRVSVAVDGAQAWKQLQGQHVDLVVSDVQMPKMDGLELTRRIRQSQALKTLPVVLVTQLDQPDDIARGAEVGADEYLVKGKYSQQQLLEAVSRLL